MKCAECGNEMETGFLYVRGFAGSLYWGTKGDTSFLSRKELQQIDLGKVSVVRPAAQAVVKAGKCAACGTVLFKAFP